MVYELTDKEQAVVMFLVFILPALVTWTGLGMPTDRAAIGILISALISGVIAALKELAGWKES